MHADPARPQLERRSSARTRAGRASRPCTARPSRRPPCRRPRPRSRRRRARPPRARAGRRAGTRRRRGSSCASPPRSAPGVARRKPPRPGMPALLTSSETRGCRSTIAAAVRSTASRSPTSQSSHSAPSSSASGRRRSSLRAIRTQSQPRPRRALATAAPIPLEPPVTTASGTRGRPGWPRRSRRGGRSRPRAGRGGRHAPSPCASGAPNRPSLPCRSVAIRRLPSRNRTDRTPRVAPAVTNSRSTRAAQLSRCGSSQLTVGRLTARSWKVRKLEFGRMFPAWSMFFDSW